MNILKYINSILVSWGVSAETADMVDNIVAFGLILLVAFVADAICRRFVLPGIGHLVKRTKATWDDIVFNPKVMTRISHIVVPFVPICCCPLLFPKERRREASTCWNASFQPA